MLFVPYENALEANFLAKGFYLITGYGHQAVMIFFVLSGFLVGGKIIESLEEDKFNFCSYLIDRFSRLYPVFFASLILGGALDLFGSVNFFESGIYSARSENPVGVIGYDAISRLNFTSFFVNFFMLQGLMGPTFGSNGPLWSIVMEFWYYIIFPLMAIPFYTKISHVRWLSVIVLIPVIFLLSLNIEFYILFTVWLLGVFVRKIKVPISSTGIAFFMLLLCLMNSRFGFGNYYIRDLLVGMGCMLIISAVLNGGHFPNFGRSFNKQISDFSFSIYCFHFPVVAFILAYLNINVNQSTLPIADRYAIFFIICVVSIGLSFLLSRITEVHTPIIRDFIKNKIYSFKFVD